MKRLTILYALSVCAALSVLAATAVAGTGQNMSQAERKARDVFMQLNANIVYPNEGRTKLNDGEEVVGLDLWYKKATDKHLAYLKDLPKLRRVVIEGKGISDAGMVHLRAVPQLEGVDLINTIVTDAGLARLAQIKEIHARRQFNASRWVNWQIGTILAAGAKDLV